jgi:hypothetical protein
MTVGNDLNLHAQVSRRQLVTGKIIKLASCCSDILEDKISIQRYYIFFERELRGLDSD